MFLSALIVIAPRLLNSRPSVRSHHIDEEGGEDSSSADEPKADRWFGSLEEDGPVLSITYAVMR
jgi:hypothetical protein